MSATVAVTGLFEDLLAKGSVTVAGLKPEFGIGRSVAYDLMQSGRLPYVQLGAKRLIPRAAVARLLAEGVHGLVTVENEAKK